MDSSRPLAVVTGASSGIGRELAKQFAAHGFDLVVAAEDAELEAAGGELRALGARVETVRVDLVEPSGVDELYGRLRAAGRPVDAIALNAGIGAGGAFATETRLDDELRVIDLNVRSTVHLAKLVVRDMVDLMPGPTDTEFFERADMLDTKVGAGDKDDPADVARDGFEALMAGKERVVSHSLSTELQARGSRFIPDSAKAAMHRRMAQPGSGKP
jgi:uncharacterized protein